MAFFYNIVYDKATERHKLEFVNQQYDYLMSIHFDEATGSYKWDVSEEEAQRICKYWAGYDFDLAHWLALATKELLERDKKPFS
jgi:hypothetical protein